MLVLSGYEISTQIYESANSLVYSGIRTLDSKAVILKLLKEDYPTPEELRRYQQEYEIARSLTIDGVVRVYSLEKYQNTLGMILEDFGGKSLKILMSDRQFTIEEILALAIKLTEILGEIHAANIIHKDINPSNIVFNSETKQLKIIDFGLSTKLSRENPTIKNPNVLEGTLAYMSPEQTGRMNRSLDYRTDFYSLGVTFYELLTGQLPFEAEDALELVHCHIAKQPVPPHQIVPEIPEILSNIVVKLMAKTAEERYQSAWGLKADLETCLTHLYSTEIISNFTLGTQDISDRFQIPQKLYGREKEIETLLVAFERVAGVPKFDPESSLKNGLISDSIVVKNSNLSSLSPVKNSSKNRSEMMLVAGYSGIGKSALVQEVYKPITEKKGYFISGKFDQFQRNIPYSAVVNAFQGLIRQLLTESEVQIQQWRSKILAAFGPSGQVIIDVIPEVELIVGKQQPVPELGPIESQNRFNLVFEQFIQAFYSKEHPLVIFLDDLQWADSETLKLIELIMADSETKYLFLIGAYRDNEVSPTHPLMLMLDSLCHNKAIINSITLVPLKLEHISQLIADTLHLGPASLLSSVQGQNISQIAINTKVKPLAELVFNKTGGNPFFVNQFLKTLHAENLIVFNRPKSIINKEGNQENFWQWDIAQIEAKGITDNVVELMVSKLRKLPASTQQILRFAACVGANFDLNTLSIICEKSQQEIFPDLVTAIQSGLVLPISELDEELLIQDYKFLHDRVQQAAYSLIPEDSKKQLHLKIGQLLMAKTPAEERSEKIFDIVNHLNAGIELLSDSESKTELANLNLIAGKKAMTSTAYKAAAKHFSLGMELLSENSWKEQYELTFAIYRAMAESEYLMGNFEKTEELFYVASNNSKSRYDKANIYSVYMAFCITQGRTQEPIDLGINLSKFFGINIPSTNEELPSAVAVELENLTLNLGSRKIADLVNEPENTDFDIKVTINLIMELWVAAYHAGHHTLLTLLVLHLVNLSLKYGHTNTSAFGYVSYGMLLAIEEKYELAFEFCSLGLNLNKKFTNKSLIGKIHNLFAHMINPYRQHLRSNVSIYQTSYKGSLECGDLLYIVWTIHYSIWTRFIIGQELKSVCEESEKYLNFLQRQTNDQNMICAFMTLQRTMLNLQGLTQDKYSLTDDIFDEAAGLRQWQDNHFLIAINWYYTLKSQIFYTYENYTEALKCAEESERTNGVNFGCFNITQHCFYYSLILAALYSSATAEEKDNYWEILNKNVAQLKKWADNCPDNFLHPYLLVAAEMARLSGQELEAIELYDLGISSAREYGFIQNEALGNELAAKFWLGKGKEEFAQLYLKKAHYGYQIWGAKRKVEDLEEKYSQLLTKASTVTRSVSTRTTNSNTTTSSQSGEALDLATVIKASQTIAGEIVLEKLLANLTKILIENAGAQVGYLVFLQKGQWLIEAAGVVDDETMAVLQSLPIDNRIPASVINYVVRTLETVVLSDANGEGNFTLDPYIKANQIKSILCVPLLNQGKLGGIVYLENNLTTGAFTSERLEILKILASQAAISIENAQLYQTLEEKVIERTAQLAAANSEITNLNERLKAENLRMSAELEVTRKLQKMILPKESETSQIVGLDVAGFMEPAKEVGGDYYDVLNYNGQVKIGIGDVTGHGLESGVLTIMVQAAVRTMFINNETDPVKFFQTVNRMVYDNVLRMNSDKNMTLVLLNYQNNMLQVSGQHEEIIVVRARGTVELINTHDLGFPIGLVEDITDLIAQTEVSLNSGDVVVLYTDGITEAIDIKGKQYGLERLCESVRLNCHKSALEIREAAIADLLEHIGTQKVYDDITILVCKQK